MYVPSMSTEPLWSPPMETSIAGIAINKTKRNIHVWPCQTWNYDQYKPVIAIESVSVLVPPGESANTSQW